MRKKAWKVAAVVVAGALLVLLEPWPTEVAAIPSFARRYGTACQTCHTVIPKLNSFGEAFRLNGYKIPEGDEALVKERPLSLGAEAWKEEFPHAIWPGSIPGTAPISIRFVTNYESTDSEEEEVRSTFESHGVHVVAGGRIDDHIGFYAQMMIESGEAPMIPQAYMTFDDPLRFAGVPDNMLNLRFGAFDPRHFLSYNWITRLQEADPLWAGQSVNDWSPTWGVSTPEGMANMFRLQDTQSGLELNGILARRFYWAAGLVNGNGTMSAEDNNSERDVYVQAKFKLFGRDFLGTFGEDEEVSMDAKPSGGWVDNSLLLEAFAYRGQWPGTEGSAAEGLQDTFNYAGFSARGTMGNLDLSAGVVLGNHSDPWFTTPAPTKTTVTSQFLKAEYMFYPWLLGRVAYEGADWDEPADATTGGGYDGSLDMQRIVLGADIAVRANIRLTIEGIRYLDHEASDANSLSTPDNFRIGLDVAF